MSARYLTEKEARKAMVDELRRLADRIEDGEGFDACSLVHQKRRDEANTTYFDVWTVELARAR